MAAPPQKIDLVALTNVVLVRSPNSLCLLNFDPSKVCTIFFTFLYLNCFIAFKGLKGVKGKVKGEVNQLIDGLYNGSVVGLNF